MTNSDHNRYVYEPNKSPGWLVNHHRANLVQLVSNRRFLNFSIRELFGVDQKRNLAGRTGFRVDFAELQRMHMRKLQINLIRHAAIMADKGEESKDDSKGTSWEKDLKDYSMKAPK